MTKQFVGPGTFQAGLEIYEVAGPAGLYLMKLKLGHCMKLVIFLLYKKLFIYQVVCTLIYRRRSLYSFLIKY